MRTSTITSAIQLSVTVSHSSANDLVRSVFCMYTIILKDFMHACNCISIKE